MIQVGTKIKTNDCYLQFKESPHEFKWIQDTVYNKLVKFNTLVC